MQERLFTACFFDGKNPKRYNASLTLDTKGITIKIDESYTHWPWADVTLVSDKDTDNSNKIILSNVKNIDERLIILEEDGLDLINYYCEGNILQQHIETAPKLTKILTSMLVTISVISVVTFSIILNPHLISPFITDSIKVKFSDEAFKVLSKDKTGVDFQDVEYTLSKTMDDLTDSNVSISITNIPLKNAFILPDGRILLTCEMLDSLKYSEELIFILLHEAGHKLYKHTDKLIVRSYGAELLNVFFNSGGDYGPELLISMFLNKFNHEDEVQADLYAFNVMKSKQYDTSKIVGFFERLDEEINIGWLSSHPNKNKRAEKFKADIENSSPTIIEEKWHSIKAVCKPVVSI